ncbi:MAG: cell division topological specificity factor MinE [Burkholderiaceae bacterium]|nr:cell division topological specificity factor MinE [Rhodoferax sp.]MCZ4313744.1 cell division topological specificity factor MinE [Comamonadaceae bacterium G21597-S1]MCB2007856.1 cell division topological specificity factor MinE [Rhodoferax sp.]MCB2043293.1 cell division topological specificity factor MinE [Rhodoferax sp.]MCW5628189.1 cell division topological specificity factor MinE [Rhodoferax sp.]
MDLMRFFKSKPKTSSLAKERLQLILAHERIGRNANGTEIPDFLPQLQKDLLAVLAKYVKVSDDDVKINVDRQDNLDLLEVKIEINR